LLYSFPAYELKSKAGFILGGVNLKRKESLSHQRDRTCECGKPVYKLKSDVFCKNCLMTIQKQNFDLLPTKINYDIPEGKPGSPYKGLPE